jgi:hypothetical protein
MSSTRSVQRFVVLIAVTAACSRSTAPDPLPVDPLLVRVRDCSGPATSLDPALAAKLPPRDGRMSPDDEWADLAERVPGGFAGVLYVAGKPVLMLTDPSRAAEAKTALAAALVGFDVRDARVQKARWNFAQLVDWYNFLGTPVFDTPGLSSGDKDEVINRIHYGVVDSAARDRLLRTLSSIQLPCDLIAVEITGPIVPLSGRAP